MEDTTPTTTATTTTQTTDTCRTCHGKNKPPGAKRPRADSDHGDGDGDVDEEEEEYERRFMTAAFFAVPHPKGDMTKVQAKKVVVDMGERNLSRTVAVTLVVDDKMFLLPLEFMQTMNKYELEGGENMYAPYPLWEYASMVADDQDEDLPEHMVKTLQKKTNLPKGSPTHPCPGEKTMSIS